ncbi:MAG: disulfide isomerase [Methylibium sp. NZG]|nr:MAG: disulfide isomerase [Methylibium sp. NZG]
MFNTSLFSSRSLLAACLGLLIGFVVVAPATAQEAVIRKNIAERLPEFPKIDEVSKTPIPGLFELRVGTELYYSDEQGNHIIEGQLIDTKSKTNLTEARINKLTVINFAELPLKDAVVWKNGTGARKLVVFADPNCGYCKRFEKDLQQVKDVTVYTFLYPILGGDSPEKSRDIWCAKDSSKVWLDWMLRNVTPARMMGECDSSALQRNTAMARKYRINGTPAVVFEDGKRVPGAMPAEAVEKQLAASRGKS